MTKTKEAPDIKPFEQLTFKEAPVLYDADVPQVISFNDRRHTKNGIIELRVAHKLNPLTDDRFLERERQFDSQPQSNKDAVFANVAPSEKLWSDLVIERVGYKPRDDWKKIVKITDKSVVLSTYMHLEADDQESDDGFNDDFLIDETETTCLSFRAFFGGISLEDWRSWLTSGKVPSNVDLSPANYDSILALIRKGIAPNILLEVRHFFHEPSKAETDAALALLFDRPDRSKLASRSRRVEKCRSERWIELYQAVTEGTEGYTGRVPAWHQVSAARAFFAQEVARLGESIGG
jgi:hypothetical protein